MISPEASIQRLADGNQRFVSGNTTTTTDFVSAQGAELAAGQSPFAVILGCSDSRVPAEIVFDQGLGDLFVIRVAGNVVAPSQVGSVEFAAAQFGTRLVVVLGHSSCGAVTATVEELQREKSQQSPNLRSIVERVQPSVAPLMRERSWPDRKALIAAAVKENVRHSMAQLRAGSAILDELIRSGGLRIVGAEYSLETGLVEFLEA